MKQRDDTNKRTNEPTPWPRLTRKGNHVTFLSLYIDIYIYIYMGKAHEIGSSRVEKNWHFTLFTMFNVTPCFKHMDYRLFMSKKPCHTIFFSFRMVGPQSWVPRVTKSSCFLRYPQDSSDILCFNHVQINTYDLWQCMIHIVDDHGWWET